MLWSLALGRGESMPAATNESRDAPGGIDLRAASDYFTGMRISRCKSLSLTVVALLGALLTGCTTPSGAPNNTGTGALIGGVSGAGLGALISHGHPEGALLGAAAGAITGGLVGNAADQAQRPVYVAPPPPAPRYAWVGPQWVWNGYAWVWAPGHWVVVP